jgi:hypothetical protein
MKLSVTAPLPDSPRSIMRRLGYGETPGHKGETSYARRIRGTPFPRLHAYVNETPTGIDINVHLDQKAPSYEGSRAHSGEYGGPIVSQEIARMEALIRSLRPSTPTPPPAKPQEEPEKKGGFFSRFFS